MPIYPPNNTNWLIRKYHSDESHIGSFNRGFQLWSRKQKTKWLFVKNCTNGQVRMLHILVDSSKFQVSLTLSFAVQFVHWAWCNALSLLCSFNYSCAMYLSINCPFCHSLFISFWQNVVCDFHMDCRSFCKLHTSKLYSVFLCSANIPFLARWIIIQVLKQSLHFRSAPRDVFVVIRYSMLVLVVYACIPNLKMEHQTLFYYNHVSQTLKSMKYMHKVQMCTFVPIDLCVGAEEEREERVSRL